MENKKIGVSEIEKGNYFLADNILTSALEITGSLGENSEEVASDLAEYFLNAYLSNLKPRGSELNQNSTFTEAYIRRIIGRGLVDDRKIAEVLAALGEESVQQSTLKRDEAAQTVMEDLAKVLKQRGQE